MGAATVVYNPSQSFALSFAQINNSWPQENRPITTESKKVCNVCVGVGVRERVRERERERERERGR